MVTSIRKKFYLQYSVFFLLSLLNKLFWHNEKKILLYINLEFRDNIKALFDFLVEEGYNEKYKIVCSSFDYDLYSNMKIKNVKFVNKVKGIFYYFTCGYVFYCIGKYPILPGRNQNVVQMWHGAPFKSPDEGMLLLHSKRFLYYTTILSTSRHFVPIWSHHFSFPEEKIFVGGYPRCDVLFQPNPNYDFGDYEKLIVWAPTFRKSEWTGENEMEERGNLLPVLKNDELKSFDEFLMSTNVKIVVKLHPVQDVEGMRIPQMSNLILISHTDFVSKGMDFYKFLVQTDALITDYSSIFVDYLLLDRPIAFTEDDLEEYNTSRGFSCDNPEKYKAGEKIVTKDDLQRFIVDVLTEKDTYKAERLRVNNMVNDYRNGNYSKRLLDYVGIVKGE